MKYNPSKPKPRLKPSEFNECLAFVQYLEMKSIQYCHIHQETYTTSWKQKNKAKALGVKAGLPDYLCLLPSGIIFIEMKKARGRRGGGGGVLSPAQKEWIAALNNTPNVKAFVAYGAEEAVDILEKELEFVSNNYPQL